MPIQVDVYIAGGMASGVLVRAAHLRDVLEGGRTLELDRVSWRGSADPVPRPVGTIPFPVDDILVAVAHHDPSLPVHATWHAIRLEMGPYVVQGELPTLPGFDPGRALTRPSGEFVMLRDVSLGLVGSTGEPIPIGAEGLVNRYGVDRVSADLMLGFFFPGAEMDGLDGGEPASEPEPSSAGAVGTSASSAAPTAPTTAAR